MMGRRLSKIYPRSIPPCCQPSDTCFIPAVLLLWSATNLCHPYPSAYETHREKQPLVVSQEVYMLTHAACWWISSGGFCTSQPCRAGFTWDSRPFTLKCEF